MDEIDCICVSIPDLFSAVTVLESRSGSQML
jgi:hypothetical protein